jgi:hypothetical protein
VYIKCISIYTGKIRNAKTFLLFDIVGVLRIHTGGSRGDQAIWGRMGT